MRLDTGTLAVLRHFQHDQPAAIMPARVVRHDQAGLLIWAGKGAAFWLFDPPDGRTIDATPLDEWIAAPKAADRLQRWHGQLSWHPVGKPYSIRWMFGEDGTFLHWYANLEVPAVVWRDDQLAGLDTTDWDLDVVIAPNRSWKWKDEDVFAERLAQPDAYWVDDEKAVRTAGLEVIELAEAGLFPFDGTWVEFEPEEAWAIPAEMELPPGWDRPRAF